MLRVCICIPSPETSWRGVNDALSASVYFGVIVTLPEVLWSSVPQCGETRQTLAGTEQAAPACASLPLESACRLAAAPGGGRTDLTQRGRGLSGKLPKPPASRALCHAKRGPRAAFPSSCLAAQTKRWAEGTCGYLGPQETRLGCGRAFLGAQRATPYRFIELHFIALYKY